jgi:oxygen-dependent protoporphyrinogen oxidase
VSFYRGGDVEALGDRELVAQAQADLTLATGARPAADPRAVVVQRWNDVIPRYAPGHAGRLARLARELRLAAPGIHLAGNHVAGVSVDQVVGAGRAAAAAVRASAQEAAA